MGADKKGADVSDWGDDLGLNKPRRPKFRVPVPYSPKVEPGEPFHGERMCWDGVNVRVGHYWVDGKCLFCGRKRAQA